MVALSDYRDVAAGEWCLFALDKLWSAKLQDQVLALVRAQATARHPQTIELSDEIDGEAKGFFLKVFHRTTVSAAIKDQIRGSRAFGSWQQGLALAAAGFKVPLAIAVGVESGWRVARREFILTAKLTGSPLTTYLSRSCATGAAPLRFKRDNIIRLAHSIRRFHGGGFVHGDLVATNILLAAERVNHLEFYFMDNDRTRRYPSWLRQPLWKRNLIQLNRLPLRGISLQDRMRFLHAYLNVRRLSGADREFARWLEARTRQRRKECDNVDSALSFRRLMQWVPETARAENV